MNPKTGEKKEQKRCRRVRLNNLLSKVCLRTAVVQGIGAPKDCQDSAPNQSSAIPHVPKRASSWVWRRPKRKVDGEKRGFAWQEICLFFCREGVASRTDFKPQLQALNGRLHVTSCPKCPAPNVGATHLKRNPSLLRETPKWIEFVGADRKARSHRPATSGLATLATASFDNHKRSKDQLGEKERKKHAG